MCFYLMLNKDIKCEWSFIGTKPWHLCLCARWENGKRAAVRICFHVLHCWKQIERVWPGNVPDKCMQISSSDSFHREIILSQRYLFVNLLFLFIKTVLFCLSFNFVWFNFIWLFIKKIYINTKKYLSFFLETLFAYLIYCKIWSNIGQDLNTIDKWLWYFKYCHFI